MHSIPRVVELVVKPSRAPCKIARLCEPWGEFVGAGQTASRGVSYHSVRLARRCCKKEGVETHLPSESQNKLAWGTPLHGDVGRAR